MAKEPGEPKNEQRAVEDLSAEQLLNEVEHIDINTVWSEKDKKYVSGQEKRREECVAQYKKLTGENMFESDEELINNAKKDAEQAKNNSKKKEKGEK